MINDEARADGNTRCPPLIHPICVNLPRPTPRPLMKPVQWCVLPGGWVRWSARKVVRVPPEFNCNHWLTVAMNGSRSCWIKLMNSFACAQSSCLAALPRLNSSALLKRWLGRWGMGERGWSCEKPEWRNVLFYSADNGNYSSVLMDYSKWCCTAGSWWTCSESVDVHATCLICMWCSHVFFLRASSFTLWMFFWLPWHT